MIYKDEGREWRLGKGGVGKGVQRKRRMEEGVKEVVEFKQEEGKWIRADVRLKRAGVNLGKIWE